MTNLDLEDQTTTTPFLVRAFSKHGSFHRLSEFERDRLPEIEHDLYLWKTSTLGDIVDLLAPELARSVESHDSFQVHVRLIYGDYQRQRYEVRDLGVVQFGTKGFDHNKTLDQARFVVGDWIDLAILQPGDRSYTRLDRRTPFTDSVNRGGNRGNRRMSGQDRSRVPYERHHGSNRDVRPVHRRQDYDSRGGFRR